MKKVLDCCGCGICQAVCPVGAIRMRSDREGFEYPVINTDLCTGCGKCAGECAFLEDKRKRSYDREEIDTTREIYIGRSKDIDIINNSRSGGIFAVLSDYILSVGGAVCGVIMDDDLRAIHVCSEDVNIRDKMKGSKYVQSKMDSRLFGDIKERLNKGQIVLFTGTSCQIASLKKYIDSDKYDNLILLDIVCHGVVSPLILKLYISIWEDKLGMKCNGINFRDKGKYGWTAHYETLFLSKEDEKAEISSGIYRNIFYEHYALRPSCYSCPYKSQEHPGDITVADCWGIEKVCPEYADDKGCSLIFINSEKGKKYFKKIIKQLDVKKEKMQEALFQAPLSYAFNVDKEKRELFWEEILNENIEAVFQKHGHGKFESPE